MRLAGRKKLKIARAGGARWLIAPAAALVLLLAIAWVFQAGRSGADQVVIPYRAKVEQTLDGLAAPGEYAARRQLAPGWTIDWVHDGEYLYMSVAFPAEGWVGLGFVPADGGKNTQGAIMVMVGDEEGETVSQYVLGTGAQVLVQPGDGPPATIRRQGGGAVAEMAVPLDLPPGNWDLETLEPGGAYRFVAAFHRTSSVFQAYHGKNRQSLPVTLEAVR